MIIALYSVVVLVIIVALAIAIPTMRFARDKKIEERLWNEYKPTKIASPGAVERLSILPVIDYYPENDELTGEPGVSYLITVDDKKILFDTGYNVKGEHPSPLLKNMEKLGIKLDDIDTIVISHLHFDHVGGKRASKHKTFAVSGGDVDLSGTVAYVPSPMHHPTADMRAVTGPSVISRGVVSTGPICRALWLMGLTAEQSLAINIEGKGIVLVVGCGHPTIERIVKRVEDLFDQPLYGIIGGLHYPVTASRMKFNIQRLFATGKPPWRRITKADVNRVVARLVEKNPNIIGISAHDSCDWTLDIFRKTFRNKYREVIVGKEIRV